jgi:hypothetical protein
MASAIYAACQSVFINQPVQILLSFSLYSHPIIASTIDMHAHHHGHSSLLPTTLTSSAFPPAVNIAAISGICIVTLYRKHIFPFLQFIPTTTSSFHRYLIL